MIDWLTFIVPFRHGKEIMGNVTSQTDSDGNLRWVRVAPQPIKGSYENQVNIKSEHHDGYCSHLYVSGNITKFFQGHNAFGTDDAFGLAKEFLLALPNHIDLDPLESPIAHVLQAQLKRLDINYGFRFESREQVNHWITAVERSATLRHRGRGNMTSGTLYYGKTSKRWALKFYSKGKELDDNKRTHRAVNKSIREYADSLLRAEVVLRGKELMDKNINTFSDLEALQDIGIAMLFESYLSKIEIGNIEMKTIDYQEKLSSQEQVAYQMWLQGFDLREVYPRPTYYRHRKNIYNKIGVNVAVPSTDEFKTLTFPTIEFIRAKFEPVPHWAYGTDLYFEPRAGLRAVA
jgi:II/X family phage/plasmid replication protein